MTTDSKAAPSMAEQVATALGRDDLISRKAAMEAIQSLRHAAAWNFSPEYSGSRGQARTDSFYEAYEAVRKMEPAALASTAGAGAWRPMNTAPSDTPIVARHKPNSRTPHGWVATISRAPEDPDERVGGLDTILHYNGDALKRGFHGVWVGWMYPEEFAALALSAGTLSVGWDGARDAFARIVEDRAWTAEHGEPRAACLRAASDIRQAKAPAVPASPRTGAGEGEGKPDRSEAVWDYTSALQSVVWRICNGRPITDDLLKRAPHAAGMAAKFMAASPPAPAEHGVEIRETIEGFLHNWFWSEIECSRLSNCAEAIAKALSQGGEAGRSERAVEIRELSEKATQGEWAFWPDHYAIKTATSFIPDEKVIAKTSCGSGAERLNGTFIATLVNAYRSGELVHRSEIAGRSEKGAGDGLERAWVVSNGEAGDDLRYRMWSGRAWVWTPSLAQAAHFARRQDARQILPDGDEHGQHVVPAAPSPDTTGANRG